MSAKPIPAYEGVPFLENGDRLTRDEFERRYEAMPWVKKAELVEGVTYMGSPVSIRHGRAHGMIAAWLTAYWAKHPEYDYGDNTTVRLDADNEFQPDSYLRKPEGGTSTEGEKYLEGPPELVVEVAASSASLDTHMKKNVYRRAGGAEYVVWRVRDEEVDWFVLERGAHVRREPDAKGVIESAQFPGLRLDVAALVRGDLAAVLRA